MDMTQEIIEMISAGDLDNSLAAIEAEIKARRDTFPCPVCGLFNNLHSPSCPSWKPSEEDEYEDYQGDKQDFRVGQTVKVVGKLKPNYLLGHTFRAEKVNDKTVNINVPRDPKYRRFSGSQGVRIPKSVLEIVGGS